jgi:hypothetical protein
MDKAQFTAVLENLAPYLDKNCELELPDTPTPFPAYVFNPRGVDAEAYEEWMEDTFCDGIPDALDPEQHIPFAKDGACPVLAIDVDGTAIVRTFRKLLSSTKELKLTPR